MLLRCLDREVAAVTAAVMSRDSRASVISSASPVWVVPPREVSPRAIASPMVEHLDLTTLRCGSGDRNWRACETARKALRNSIGDQIGALAASYAIPLQGEFTGYLPQ